MTLKIRDPGFLVSPDMSMMTAVADMIVLFCTSSSCCQHIDIHAVLKNEYLQSLPEHLHK